MLSMCTPNRSREYPNPQGFVTTSGMVSYAVSLAFGFLLTGEFECNLLALYTICDLDV